APSPTPTPTLSLHDALPILDPSGRLLHACFHAALGGFRGLRAFRDVAQLILVTGADWETTFAVARRWRAEAVVVRAITESWERLDRKSTRLNSSHSQNSYAV